MLKSGWGHRLKQCREGQTQEVFAALLGIGNTAWKEYEAQKRIPRFDVMARAAELSGRSLDWIATGVEVPTVMDTGLLAQVIEAVELESGDQDVATRAKLISTLYKLQLSRQKKEQDGNNIRGGRVA